MKLARNLSFALLLVTACLVQLQAAPPDPECPELCSEACQFSTDIPEYKRCALGFDCEADYGCAVNKCNYWADECNVTYGTVHWNGFCDEPAEQYECWFPTVITPEGR